jgi:RNA polymerase sigma-70 factor (ECF subfamily)
VVDSNYEDEWLVDDAITLDEIKDAIGKLPDKYRYVVMLFLVEGYDHQEISEILNITEVASRTQLSRGKVKLKEQLTLLQDGTRH